MAHRSADAQRGRAWPRQAALFSRISNSVGKAATSKRTMSQILIVVQNSVLLAAMHRSRTPSAGSGSRYLASTAILLVEITKLFVSLSIVTYSSSKAHPSARLPELARLICQNLCSTDALMLIIPAALYTLQNFLIYVAISNMQAVAFQVTYQLKILTTVLFSILLLRRSISARQWVSMVLLTLGVAVVQVSQQGSAVWPCLAELRSWALSPFRHPAGPSVEDRGQISSLPPLAPSPFTDTSKGFLAAVGASVISGLTSVYFEKLVKQSLPSVSLWTRNVQLAFFSLFPAAFVGVLWQDGAAVSRNGFFAGYSPLVWTVIGLQALGGLLVAICVAYADNITKNFAASLSIVVSYAIGSIMFSEPVTLHSTFGIFAILFATYLYQSRGHQPVNDSLLPMSKKHDITALNIETLVEKSI